MSFRTRHSKLSIVLLGLTTVMAAEAHAQQNVEGSFVRSLSVAGPVDLEVATGSGDIQIRAGDAGRVEIRGTIRVGAHNRGQAEAQSIVQRITADPPIEQTGDAVRIGRLEDPELQRNVSISYEITVPAQSMIRSNTGSGAQTISNIEGSVVAGTGSGGIRLNNIQGRVQANTGSGEIRAEGIAGAFEGRTGSGSVRLTQTAPGDVTVTTGSGSVEISGVRGALQARTGSGRITATGEPTGRWGLQTGSGDIVVRLPSQAAFNLHAETSSGAIDVDHPLTVQGRIGNRREITGTVRGGGFALEARTSSGDIRIE